MAWPDFTDKTNWRDRFSREVLARDAQKSVHSLFMKDWTLKALALVIALVLWYGVTGQRAPVTERIPGARVNFVFLDSLVVSNNPRQDVTLTLTGQRQAIDRLRGRDLDVVVNINDLGPGEHTVLLNSNRVQVSQLPAGVTYSRIEPNAIKVHLENRITRSLPVEVKISGQVADGYELYGTSLQPAYVNVRGPESRVSRLEKVQSEIVEFNGQKNSLSLDTLRLRLPDDAVDLVDATTVKALFSIGEARIERALTGVVARAADGGHVTPEKADVIVYGPRSIVAGLRPEDLEIVVSPSENSASPGTLKILRQEWADALQLRATKPANFTLKKN